jgi:uncharacterized protein
MSNWAWDPIKAIANLKKHGVSFELASAVFLDPFNISEPDDHPDGDRWGTIGQAGAVILFVSHTLIEPDLEFGRIISARRATTHERKRYAEGSYT